MYIKNSYKYKNKNYCFNYLLITSTVAFITASSYGFCLASKFIFGCIVGLDPNSYFKFERFVSEHCIECFGWTCEKSSLVLLLGRPGSIFVRSVTEDNSNIAEFMAKFVLGA